MGRLIIFGSGGSEGIPCLFCNCRVCSSKEHKKRVGYAVEIGGISIWLELSPDVREQLLNYGKIPHYFFVSHLHFDHVSGIKELRQGLIIGKTNNQQIKINIIIPMHLKMFLESIKPFIYLFRESFVHDFWELELTKKLNIISLHPLEEFWLTDKVKIIPVDNVHKGILSTSIFIISENKCFLYLSDADKLDDDIYRLCKKYKPNLVLAHTPFIKRYNGHIGIEDLLNLNADKIVLSHFSHKIGLLHSEIEENIKKYGNHFIAAKDNMIIEF